MGSGTSSAVGIRRVLDCVDPNATTGIGSLPHRKAASAVEFTFEAFDLPAIPSLPRRCPAESSVAQALAGVAGVTAGQYGTVAVDVERLDPDREVATDLRLDNFYGFRRFLEIAGERDYSGPIKWQFIGPISVGVALCRAGADPRAAFKIADVAVRSHLEVLVGEVARALPDSPQLVVLNEPFAADLMAREFPLAPDAAIDLLSTAMATIEPVADVGVHCCSDADIVTMLESGPSVLSLPVNDRLIPLTGYLDRFLRNGGWIAWGAVATERPIGVTAQRAWQQLATLWCELVQRGCDPELLRSQSLLTPECGLGSLNTEAAERVCSTLELVSRAARGESAAARFVLGA